jgi:hypothetical protein
MKPRQLIILALFLLGGFVAFSNILTSYFLSDDFAQIGKVLGGDLSLAWGQEHGGFFRPLFILSYFVDLKIWGPRPVGFHLTNVAFHSLNAFLTYALASRAVRHLKVTPAIGRSFAIAAGTLFLLHPSHTEAISWISGRADLMATCFCLASLLAYLAYVESQKTSLLMLSLSGFALALLAKESAICLPFVVLLIGVFAGEMRRGQRRFLTQIALYLFILFVFVAVRSGFLGSVVGGYGVSQHLNFAPGWLRDRLLEAAVRSVLPVLPLQLSRFLFKPLQSPVFISFTIVCVAAIVGIVILRRRQYGVAQRAEQNRFLLLLAGLFLISLLPVINLRLTLYQSLGERFLYLPTVFSCSLMAYVTSLLIRRRALWLSVLMVVLGFYAVRLYETNQVWREAAVLSHSIKDQISDLATGKRLLVINVPDNLRGVPVFHNGLSEALRDFQNQKQFDQIEVLAFQELQTSADELELQSFDQSQTIHLINDQGEFARTETLPCLEILAETKTSLELRAKPCLAGTQLFIFDKGRMTLLP